MQVVHTLLSQSSCLQTAYQCCKSACLQTCNNDHPGFSPHLHSVPLRSLAAWGVTLTALQPLQPLR